MKTRLLPLFLLLPLLAGAQTYTYSTLVNFPPATQQGPFWPASPLLIDAGGNLYGTSLYGGIYGSASGGYGTAFKVTPQGVLTVLHNFGNGADGQVPEGNLTWDAAGNVYGTTYVGGSSGVGTVYKLTPDGKETVLYNFGYQGLSNTQPGGGVTLDARGNLYGFFYRAFNFTYDGGDIFKLTPQGVFSTVYHWCPYGEACFNKTGTNGPSGNLITNSAGGFFGVTVGFQSVPGVVFELSPKNGLSTLYTFSLASGSAGPPMGTLAQDAKGNLFGIGNNGVYEVTAGGVESVLYLFPDHSAPYPTPLLDSHDNVYGTTQQGGTNGLGTVYMVSPSGTETVLYNATSDGPVQGDGLVMDKAGNLYGTCRQCGTNQTGLIYKLTKNAD
jgi:uncharacterized repeat protein (TIGR03803 family)